LTGVEQNSRMLCTWKTLSCWQYHICTHIHILVTRLPITNHRHRDNWHWIKRLNKTCTEIKIRS